MSARLGSIEHDLQVQSVEAKRTRRAYGIFGVAAVGIALANMLLIAAKLEDKNGGSTATRAAQAAPVAAAPAPLTHASAVRLAEYKIAPSPPQAKAGRVTFNLHNAGKVTHEFVVIRTNRKASQLLKGNSADESGSVGEAGNITPGQTRTLKLNLKAGHYALICNLPGHYRLGQHSDFTVK